LFELFFFGGGHHAGFEAFDEVVAAAFEKEADVATCFGVAFVGGETGDAGSEAAMNVILQARARMAASKINGAAWDEEALVNEMQDAAGEAGGKIRTEIERAIFLDAAREVDAGISFGSGEFDVRVGFVVPEHDVELRAVLLDEIVFESEGFAFVTDKDGLEVSNFAGQRTGFCVDPTGFEKIRTHAAAERRSFADIQDVADGVFEQIDAGAFGEKRSYFTGFHVGTARNFCLSANLHHTRIVKRGSDVGGA